ncbi:MAG TPA: META domain-containing protein [Chitinophaga sp.]
MKTTFVMACLLLGGLYWAACSSPKPAAGKTSATNSTSENPSLLYNTDWKLVSIQGEAIDTTGMNRRPGIRFEKNQHRVSGNGGCNGMGGSFTVTGNKLHFSPLISTRMACPALAVENKYFKALEQVTRFEVSEGRLELLNDSGSLAIFSGN